MSGNPSDESSIGAVESLYRARSYQLEMLEQSLAGNIIIAVPNFHETFIPMSQFD